MSTTSGPGYPPGSDSGGTPAPSPLLVSDPPRIGDFWLDARLLATPAGVAFIGHDDADTPVLLVLLSEGAAADAAARSRLSGEVNHLHAETVVARGGQGQDEGRLGHLFRDEEDDPTVAGQAPLAPWVALINDGTPGASAEALRILRAVDLTMTGQLGDPSGPDYRLHWIDRDRPGTSRTWPLPWPGRQDRAGWSTVGISWLIIVTIAALGLLIAVLLFQNIPPSPPPPPVPTSASGSGGSGSPSSGSPSSGSPSSGSPSSGSPSSGSPSPSGSSGSPSSGSPNQNTPSAPPTMNSPGGSGSPGSASPTPTRNKKL
ncbi:MAG: hypothetical protein L0K74_08390 [Acidipropionibacterium acidipropionici]|nr:hypothetical protein [Acidipropionibacterium acidipropionici]